MENEQVKISEESNVQYNMNKYLSNSMKITVKLITRNNVYLYNMKRVNTICKVIYFFVSVCIIFFNSNENAPFNPLFELLSTLYFENNN